MDVLSTLLEILKYTIPALVVYFLFRQFIRYQIALENARRKRTDGSLLPQKLQACERLTLFVERITLRNLLLRLQSDEMSMSELRHAMLISIQKEFEHNLTQQIYISQQLWDMVKLLKDQTLNEITTVFLANENKSIDDSSPEILKRGQALESQFTSRVLNAIRKEVELTSA